MMTHLPLQRPSRHTLVSLIVSLGAALGAGAIGSLATAASVNTWYATLAKPAFNPPNWVFAPVWTTLYILMGLAAWRVWRAEPAGPRRRAALGLYGAQLVLNLVWSLIFFGARQPGLALAEVVVLLCVVVATAAYFWRIDRPAALMLAPYAAWVAFASALNFEIWRLN